MIPAYNRGRDALGRRRCGLVSVVSVLSSAKTILSLAQAAGLARSSTDQALKNLETRLRGLVEAPLHEGLNRVKWAAQSKEPRRSELLREARSKLLDAVARPDMPPRAAAVACVAGAAVARELGDEDDARTWMANAVAAYDRCVATAYQGMNRTALVGDRLQQPALAWHRSFLVWCGAKGSFAKAVLVGSSLQFGKDQSELAALTREVSDAHAFARELGVNADGHSCSVRVVHFRGVVVKAKVMTHGLGADQCDA